ncbi:ABC transporter permease [Fictibacillus terranigra]|uniref:ABC transporter permease n=1 Tax=Fictibacillus terranigra TaxID=3058424 RepID=A0ABT8EBW4_9BACL|nr:ABC transporter permease [Fictibacillus sp. CENA-BCM004]MDN4075420.1 ABC transporter permease [Fictibacillus sp. CENA-BCM004]
MKKVDLALHVPSFSLKKRKRIPQSFSYPSVTLVIILFVWELCGRLNLIDPFMFSWPSKIFAKAQDFFATGEVFKHLAVSGMEVGFGFAMALIGIPIGLMMGYWKKLELTFDPFVTALYTTPMIALTPLFVLWFGLETLSKVMMVFALSIFPILINTMAGVKMTDISLIKAARSYGASERQMFKEVIFPSAIPFIITGIRLAIGRALIAVVVAEMLAGNIGIGFAIRHASELFHTAEYLAYVVVLMVLSVLLTELLKKFEKKLAPWRDR